MDTATTTLADVNVEYWSGAAAGIGLVGDTIRLVRCLDCLHCQLNPHTPSQGWTLCGLGCRRNDGWPGKPRMCVRSEQKAPAP